MKLFGFHSSRDFDMQLLASVLVLVCIGILSVYSATQTDQAGFEGIWRKQLLSLAIGLAVMVVAVIVPYRYLEAFAWPIYGISLVLLIVALLGPKHMNTHRWIQVGGQMFQPSEIAKMATILALAKLIYKKDMDRAGFLGILLPIAIVVVPLVLVLIEPDLGTALSFGALFIAMIFWQGYPVKNILYLLSPVLSMVAVFSMPSWIVFMILLLLSFWFFRMKFKYASWIFMLNTVIGSITPFLWQGLKDYQRMRIMIFLNPGIDPRGAGWHVLQSKIAVGSGGFWGQGFLEGTQKKLSFLPEQHTDFIFATFGEEFGFIGCLLLLLLFFWTVYRGIVIARQARNRFAGLAAVGILSIFGYHVILNIGMALGILPVTGIPLPFLSFGGSALIINLMMVGLLLNIGLRRYEY
ncbi:MAG: rod shape-determining protein RodA [Candidatus Edwardsbacteria bacterium]|nr:rod shape-determining protein RodA [Candidatus Edwardsbacteria bacterium]MBU1576454.1 rod shape-determining protein RodA [Candidatus Edwardsbacteria bacterium]MBU2464487.1 rod shape-determining protein RodA [Candidatus Edwardsbacteria bacterium]MBU2594527.1 rod shape-determining protein RodA [Candidatus Edwardsbacteria bacterium]